MGVMLTLDGPRQFRSRRRAQHKRTPEEQACVDAFSAFLRYDAPGAGRCLSRLGASVLARRLLPAAKALADAVDLVLAEEIRAAEQTWVTGEGPATGEGPVTGDARPAG